MCIDKLLCVWMSCGVYRGAVAAVGIGELLCV